MNRVGLAVLALGAAATAGCAPPRPKFATHPAQTLTVPYERASGQTSCLVASVVMASNYLAGQPRFTEPGVLKALK